MKFLLHSTTLAEKPVTGLILPFFFLCITARSTHIWSSEKNFSTGLDSNRTIGNFEIQNSKTKKQHPKNSPELEEKQNIFSVF